MRDGVSDKGSVADHRGCESQKFFGKNVTSLPGLLDHVVPSLQSAHNAVYAVYWEIQLG